jgi:hypothetical protein
MVYDDAAGRLPAPWSIHQTSALGTFIAEILLR